MTADGKPQLAPLQREYLARNPEASLIGQSDDLTVVPASGVGGWLGLLRASLLAFGPLLNAVRTKDELESDLSAANAHARDQANSASQQLPAS